MTRGKAELPTGPTRQTRRTRTGGGGGDAGPTGRSRAGRASVGRRADHAFTQYAEKRNINVSQVLEAVVDEAVEGACSYAPDEPGLVCVSIAFRLTQGPDVGRVVLHQHDPQGRQGVPIREALRPAPGRFVPARHTGIRSKCRHL